MPVLLPYPSESPLATRLLAGKDDVPDLALRHFPDGETYLRLHGPVEGRDVCVICNFDRPDSKLMGLICLADLLRESGARRVILASPYLPYMRQDIRFHAGEAITSRTFASLISHYFDALLTVDPHLHRYDSLDEIYSIPSHIVRAAPAVAAWIVTNVARPVLIGPDAESEQWVRDVAGRAQAPSIVLRKVRRGDRDVEIEVPDLDRWQAHTPVLLDDIISTGQTLAQTVRGLRALALHPPVCIGVHAVFAEGAEDALREAGSGEIVSCNTLAHHSNRIDLGAEFAAGLYALFDQLDGVS